MRKTLALFLSLICTITFLVACDNFAKRPEIDLSQATKIDVIYYIGGQGERWTVDSKADIDNLLEWLSNLELRLKHFDEGNSPGDSNGGEVFMFSSDSDEFSYIKNGSNDCYILYESDWYKVKNPTDPFDDLEQKY